MSTTNGAAVIERVQAALVEAAQNGEPEPGRHVLARQLGVKPHQVRQAKERLRNQPATLAPDPTENDAPEPTAGPAAHALAGTDDTTQTEPDQPGATPDRQENQQDTSVAPTPERGARLVAWVGFAFGSIMSIAANVLYTWIPPENAPPEWTPNLAPQIGSAVWPIGLLISVEVLSRVAWKPGKLWGLARYGGAGTVAIGSGIISYGHLKSVLLHWNYDGLGASVGPLVLDGLMVISGFAMLSMSRRQGGAS